MKITQRLFILVLITLSFSVQGQQDSEKKQAKDVKEVQYVTDKLRLSLYKKADGNSSIEKLLISGDKLYVLDKSGAYSKVRTEDGDTGWVKNGFLLSDPTDSYLLIEEQKKNAILSSQLNKYSDTQKIVEDYENTIEKMNQDTDSTLQEMTQVKNELEQYRIDNSELQQQLDGFKNEQISLSEAFTVIQSYWYAVLGSLLVFLFIGYSDW